MALTAEERLRLIVMTRRLASDLGRGEMPIIIGTVGQTNKDIIAQLHASHAAGADFGLVLTPDYFHFAMDSSSILDFFISVRHTKREKARDASASWLISSRWLTQAQYPLSFIVGPWSLPELRSART